VRPVGPIIRQKDPNNLEMPFDQLNDFITPSELFYMRSHFPTPELDPVTWRLSIGGAVRNALGLSCADNRAKPSRTCLTTLERAGNSRVFLLPPGPGAQWELGAVGNAEWTGVPLAVLLELTGLADDVCDLVLEGADRARAEGRAKTAGSDLLCPQYLAARTMQPDVLIAYRMNGQDLTPDHGYPLRAIVAGHYGMASVKWLTGMVAVTQPFQSYWQTSDWAAVRHGKPAPWRQVSVRHARERRHCVVNPPRKPPKDQAADREFSRGSIKRSRGPDASASPANRIYHLVDLRFFAVDGGTGAKQSSLHGSKAGTGRRKRRARRVGAGRRGAAAEGTASDGPMRSHTAAGKRRGGCKTGAKGDAGNGKLFHADTSSQSKSRLTAQRVFSN
jgi:DMSO/TMAO reductase YedYZ molybdopterin-dependent catalytic subunit